LLIAWSAYWIALSAIALGPGLLAAWRARSPGGRGSISVGYDAGMLNASVVVDGATTWSGTASLASTLLWIAGPPLVLWIAWLLKRPRRAEIEPDRVM
jgi:hypothetical protein